MTEAPSWPETVGRMSAVAFRTATGSLHFSGPDRDGGPPRDGSLRFWFAVPGRWRVEDERGVVHVEDDRWRHVRDEQGRMQRMPAEEVGGSFAGWHPWDLLGTVADRGRRFTRDGDFSTPTGPGVARDVAGRAAWQFELAPPHHEPHPLLVTIDDATGTVLGLAVPAAGAFVEMTEFVPDAEMSDDLFSWDGPVVSTWEDARAGEAREVRWLHEQRLPVPRWWPSGVPHVPVSGNESSGAYCVHLEVEGGATLARWPVGGRKPRSWDGGGSSGHVHRWADGTWEWALSVPQPLSDEELRRVASSIPTA